jgi:hypothetical protein
VPLHKPVADIDLWAIPGGAFVFFMFFGLSGEARQEYKQIFRQIVRPLGIKSPAVTPQNFSWYVYIATFHGRSQKLNISLAKSPIAPVPATELEAVTLPITCPTFDAVRSTDNPSDSSAADHPSPGQIKHHVVDSKVHNAEPQTQ